MPSVRRCSHCGEGGHNIQTCPTMTTEQRASRRATRMARLQGNASTTSTTSTARRRRRAPPSSSPGNPPLQWVNITNTNSYPISIFWRFKDGLSASPNWTMFSTVVSENCATKVRISKNHIIRIVPTLELVEDIGYISFEAADALFKVDEVSGEDFLSHGLFVIVPGTDGTDEKREYEYATPKKDYGSPTDPLTMWKHAGLKSKFLLDELIRLGAKNKDDSYEVILDLVQDIHIPEHTEMDKESAGIPSAFTNIT